MNDSFRLALEKHQQGFPDQAAQLDSKVFSREPEHADALHLLGVVAHQQGRHSQAIGLIRQALALKPGMAMYDANLAEAYRTPAEYELAAASATTALRLRPDFAEPANTLGLLLEQPPIGLENRSWCCALRCDRRLGAPWLRFVWSCRECPDPAGRRRVKRSADLQPKGSRGQQHAEEAT